MQLSLEVESGALRRGRAPVWLAQPGLEEVGGRQAWLGLQLCPFVSSVPLATPLHLSPGIPAQCGAHLPDAEACYEDCVIQCMCHV